MSAVVSKSSLGFGFGSEAGSTFDFGRDGSSFIKSVSFAIITRSVFSSKPMSIPFASNGK